MHYSILHYLTHAWSGSLSSEDVSQVVPLSEHFDVNQAIRERIQHLKDMLEQYVNLEHPDKVYRVDAYQYPNGIVDDQILQYKALFKIYNLRDFQDMEYFTITEQVVLEEGLIAAFKNMQLPQL